MIYEENQPVPALRVPRRVWVLPGVVLVTAVGPFLLLYFGNGRSHAGLTDGVAISTAAVSLWAAVGAMCALLYASRTVKVALISDERLRTATLRLQQLIERIESVSERENRIVVALGDQIALATHVERHEFDTRLAAERVRVLENVAGPMAGTYAAARSVVRAYGLGDELGRAGNELLRQHSRLDAELLLLPDADLPQVRAFSRQVDATATRDDVPGLRKSCAEDTYKTAREEFREALMAARAEYQRTCVEHATD
jgi:hypothetical protein